MPAEYLEWKMVFDTGWTLDYIRGLPSQEIFDYLSIKDARYKAGVR